MMLPKPVAACGWTLSALHQHLQGVVDLEMWTIPYYLTVLYSIKDPTHPAYRQVQAVVYQEMLHAQLAANVANAYGLSPQFNMPVYVGANIPHVDFKLDEPNPTTQFHPFTAELGPLDERHINAMCLIEYPEWLTGRETNLSSTDEEYGSIGEFYAAVRVGIAELRGAVKGGQRQVDQFGPFYQNQPSLSVSQDGEAGFKQAMTLVDLIVEQGEGQTEEVRGIPVEFQNTADGFQDSWPHYRKFDSIRQATRRPEIYSGVADPEPGSLGQRAQHILVRDFAAFLETLTELFGGRSSPKVFGAQMAKLGGDVLTCWQHGAIPRFS